jgi:two-component system sensor histidine kinase PilS (NtrC family)
MKQAPHNKIESNAGESQLIHYLNLFRVLVAFFYVGLLFTEQAQVLGVHPLPLLGKPLALVYLAFAVLVLVLGLVNRRLSLQVGKAALVVDVFVLIYLSWSVDGIGMGLAILPIVMQGAIATLFHSALLILAMPFLASLFLWMVPVISDIPMHNATHSSLLLHSLVYFVITWLGLRQSTRAKETLTIARQQRKDIRSLTQLNEAIIDKMRTGVVVLDNDKQPVYCNRAARRLLNISTGNAIPESLLNAPHNQDKFIYATPDGEKISVYSQTPEGNAEISLLFLENSRELAKTAHEMSLTALGRLSASIAHEIRNPLSAIYTAAQLLAESPHISDEDRDMTKIISKQINRTNTIIENVLNLSRQHVASPENIELKSHLKEFLNQFCEDQKLDIRLIKFRVPKQPVRVLFDKSHLNQILWNLCKNALKHGQAEGAMPKLSVTLHASPSETYLDIMNPGPPMPGHAQKQLFEPFYTTHSQGTGLGLYLSRELCQSNNATLNYDYIGKQHRFRIHFDQ